MNLNKIEIKIAMAEFESILETRKCWFDTWETSNPLYRRQFILKCIWKRQKDDDC